MGIPSQEQDDLKQDIMTELWRAVNRSGFDFAAGFWGFVEVVTSRRCIDWLRTRRVGAQVPEDLPDSAKNPLERALVGERAILASRVLEGLEPNCQEIINLRMRDRLSYREIARKLGKNEGALRVQFYRCVKNAQQILTNMNPEWIGIKE
jgi:RNA polymerase sigma factor (sigma-70 family)